MSILCENDIIEIEYDFHNHLIEANKSGRINLFMTNLYKAYNLTTAEDFVKRKNGKIVVIGDSSVKEKDLLGIAKEYGIEKYQIEFVLDYESTKNYNYKKLQYTDVYQVVFVGPMPHKTVDTGNSSSMISEMEKQPEVYPRIIRLNCGYNGLKITKSNFREALNTYYNCYPN